MLYLLNCFVLFVAVHLHITMADCFGKNSYGPSCCALGGRKHCHDRGDYYWCSYKNCCFFLTVTAALLFALRLSMILFQGIQIDEATGPINIPAYMGRWYQIASIPQWYDRHQCFMCVTADYSLNQNYSISIHNRAYGAGCSVDGLAIIPNPYLPSRLSVSFYVPNATPSEYWIVSVGAIVNGQYQYAVVSNSQRSSLYILSRQPSMPTLTYNALVTDLKFRGYHTELLRKTLQTCSYITSGGSNNNAQVSTSVTAGYQASAGLVFGAGSAGVNVGSGVGVSATVAF